MFITNTHLGCSLTGALVSSFALLLFQTVSSQGSGTENNSVITWNLDIMKD